MTFNYNVNILNQGGNVFAQLASQASVFENHLNKVNGTLTSIDNRLAHTQQTGNNAFGSMASGARNFIATLGVAAATMGSLTTTAKAESFENAIRFSSGADGAKNLQFLTKTIDDLKLPIQAANEGYKTLAGGLMGTSLQGEKVNDIFKAVAEGTTVMGLGAEETKGSFLALAQMASKGTVSAEELRGQLGERLPGAFGIAARAMGVSQQALGKMLEKGEVLATDFLPKFAAEMHKTFGEAAKQATNSAQANFNAFGNEVFRLKLAFGQELMPTVLGFLKDYLIPSVHWLGQNIDKVGFLATVLGTAWATYKSVAVGLELYAYGLKVVNFLTPILTGEVTLLNAVMQLNPIVRIATALLAVGGAVVYAWNKFEGFRATVYGAWEMFKRFGEILFIYIVTPLMALSEILVGVFTSDFALINKGMNDSLYAMQLMAKDFNETGVSLGKSFVNGYNKGLGGGESIVDTTQLGNYYAQRDGDALSNVNFNGSKPLGKPDDNTKKSIEGINGGGRQVRNITITVGKVGVDNLTLHTTTVKEGIDKIRDMLMAEMLQVVNVGNQVQ
jgi:tape measure domain-containing protein